MKVLIVLALTVVSCKAAFLFSSGCKTDADCNDGCCTHSLFTSSCHHHIGEMSRCLLSAPASASCTSTCGQGLTCQGQNLHDLAIEPGSSSTLYGTCMKSSSATGTTTVMPTTTMTVTTV